MIIQLQEGMQEGLQEAIRPQGDYAVIAISKHGVELARRLNQSFAGTDVFYMSKFAQGDEAARGIQMFSGSVRLLFPLIWSRYKGIIAIVSLGAMVRMVAPLLEDKKTDPGIVVIDDAGKHVISMLSGHLGGANELALHVAAAIGASPVITTASDVNKTIPVDLFGRNFDWEWESADMLTPVSASVVNEERIAVVQESGERNWWLYDTPIPGHIKTYPSISAALPDEPQAALIVTHRLLPAEEKALILNSVIYRPKVLVLGIGCNRGTSAEEIEAVISETLDELQFSIRSVKAVCTIELKKDEAGLLAVCQKYGWEFVWYTPEQLNQVKLEAPSETVYKYTGVYGVSEPAAKLYTGNEQLILNKKKSGNVTLSVGMLSF